MQRLLVTVGVLVSTVLLVGGLSAQDFKLELQQVKVRQKQEMQALKLKHKYAKEALKGQETPKSVRIQMQHEMEREEKALRQKHKDELQKMKDQQRVLNQMQSG